METTETEKPKLSKKAQERLDKMAQAKAELLATGWLNEGKTVYTVLRHAAAGGMSRSISLYVVHEGEMVCLDLWVAPVLDYKLDLAHGESVKVGGCGMDMGFATVSHLSKILFDGKYDALKQKWA